MPVSLQIFARTGTLRSQLKEAAVKIAPTLYGLSGADSQGIAERVAEWLDDDNYIFPQCNDVRIILLLVDFTGYLWRWSDSQTIWTATIHSTTKPLLPFFVMCSSLRPAPRVLQT